MNNLFLTILTVAILCFARTCHGRCNEIDHGSLLQFNQSVVSTASPSLNWDLSVDCCTWEGVGCDRYGRVTKLWLPSRRLEGTISPTVFNLSSLSLFNVSNNRLSGPIPDGLFSAFHNLQVCDLSQNSLFGSISPFDHLPNTTVSLNLSSNRRHGMIQSSFFKMASNLETLDVSNNSFDGSLPSAICSFSPLMKYLDLSQNLFGGSVPLGFGRCSNLLVLRAGFNNFSGKVPQDIYGLLKLQELSLPGNMLSGHISENVVILVNLKILTLYGNELTGTIPERIGQLSNLEDLQLHINQLNGTIPVSLSNCTKLTTLNLRVNLLEGKLSTFDFSNFVQIKLVDLGENFFSGVLPPSLFSCKTVKAIRLTANSLHGEISPDIMKLQSLSFLSLSNNSLTNITSAIRILRGCKNLSTILLSVNFYDEVLPGNENLIGPDEFENLQVLGIGGCRFTGYLPPWLMKIPKLKVLDLSYNHITGNIPDWIGSLQNLFYLDLSNNYLSGYFPIELTRLPKLEFHLISDEDDINYFELPMVVSPSVYAAELLYKQLSHLPPTVDLHNNNITGTIPAEIGQLRSIIALDLSDNSIYGGIPETLSNLTNLEKLDLSRNQLSGDIPASLENLHFLSAFDVSYNNLEGPIPVGGQFDTFSSSSFEGNQDLCGTILQRSCSGSDDQKPEGSQREEQNDEEENFNWPSFLIGFGVGLFLSVLLAIQHFSKARIKPFS